MRLSGNQLHSLSVFNMMPRVTLWRRVKTRSTICNCFIILAITRQSLELHFRYRIRTEVGQAFPGKLNSGRRRSARVPESAYTFSEPADEVLRAHQWVGSQPQPSKLVKPAPKLRMNPIIISARKAPAIVILRINGRPTARIRRSTRETCQTPFRGTIDC